MRLLEFLERCRLRLVSPASRLSRIVHRVDERDLELTTTYTVVLVSRGRVVRHQIEVRSLSMMQIGVS